MRGANRTAQRPGRRDLLRGATGIGLAVAAGTLAGGVAARVEAAPGPGGAARRAAKSRVVVVRSADRREGVRQALDGLGAGAFNGKRVLIKPNCNSADPAPGSTHPDTLRTLVEWLQAQGAAEVVIGDRSGMGDTRRVMEEKGVFALGRELGARVVVFDELGADEWVRQDVPGSHWDRGFAVPRLLSETDAVVTTCNLKTHRFGGHFTLSLKNSVGLAAKTIPGEAYNYMTELHSSPNQRLMIAEINAAYTPALVLLDGVDAFTTGGPESGTRVASEVILAGIDRVAIDAVGVALLRLLGTTAQVSQGPIFAQPQLARAVELGLGAASPADIDLIASDAASQEYAGRIRAMLDAT